MPNVKAVCATGMLTVGAALLGYAIFFSESNHDVPGWEPVNKRIEEAMAALPSERPATSSQRPDKPPATAPEAPPPATASTAPATQPVKPAAAESQTPPSPANALLDLNTATQSQLEDLPGIGASKAKAIIAYREQNGAYKTVKQLLEVKGIGPKMLEKLEPYITAGTPGKG
jgi:competence protein ComEA